MSRSYPLARSPLSAASRTAVVGGVTLGLALTLVGSPTVAGAAPADLSPQRIAGVTAADGLHVYVRGTDSYLYTKTIAAGDDPAKPWTRLPRKVDSSPAATIGADGKIYVAAKSGAAVAVSRADGDGQLGDWTNLGGSANSAPALVGVNPYGMEYGGVYVAIQNSGGTVSYRRLDARSGQPSDPWRALPNSATSAGPQLTTEVGCQAPDDPIPGPHAYFTTRTPAGNADGRYLMCVDTKPDFTGVTASAIDGGWYRGTDGALWFEDTRVGVPPAGANARVASSPTIADHAPVGVGKTAADGTTVLIRDAAKQPWAYTTTGAGPTGGQWIALGGGATLAGSQPTVN